MKLIAFLLFSACAFAQGIGGKAGVGGNGGFGGGAVAAPVAPALVEAKECDGAASPLNCSLASNMTAGNTAVVIVNSNNGACETVTSTPSNVFQPWLVFNQGSIRRSVFVAYNVAIGTNSFVINCPGMSSFDSTAIFNLAPSVGNIVAADVIGLATGTGGTPSVATAFAVGSSAEEIISSVWENSDFFAWTPGAGYTTRASFNVSGGNYLGIAADNNTKTGLSGVQTTTFTTLNPYFWAGIVLGLANVPNQDAADMFIDFEGLSNGVVVTAAQLDASVHGVPFKSWDMSAVGTFSTGATTSQLGTTPVPHRIGATNWTGSGSLGLAYATGTLPVRKAIGFLQIGIPSFSWIGQFKTTLPQNDTAFNAYSMHRIGDVLGTDYVNPQLQSTGTELDMYLECKSGPSVGFVPIASNTVYYVALQAVSSGGNHSMQIYNSAGVQQGSTLTCAASAGATQFSSFEIGITGNEPEGPGVISWDNMRISLQGTALTP